MNKIFKISAKILTEGKGRNSALVSKQVSNEFPRCLLQFPVLNYKKKWTRLILHSVNIEIYDQIPCFGLVEEHRHARGEGAARVVETGFHGADLAGLRSIQYLPINRCKMAIELKFGGISTNVMETRLPWYQCPKLLIDFTGNLTGIGRVKF